MPRILNTNVTIAGTLNTNGAVDLDSNLNVDGNLGVGGVTPQGKFHAHDGTGGSMFVTKTGIVGSEVTIIPDGSGDATKGVVFLGQAADGSGNTVNLAGVVFQNPGTGSTTQTVGAISLKLYATGQFVVFRASGSATWQISGIVIWH